MKVTQKSAVDQRCLNQDHQLELTGESRNGEWVSNSTKWNVCSFDPLSFQFTVIFNCVLKINRTSVIKREQWPHQAINQVISVWLNQLSLNHPSNLKEWQIKSKTKRFCERKRKTKKFYDSLTCHQVVSKVFVQGNVRLSLSDSTSEKDTNLTDFIFFVQTYTWRRG